MLNQLTSTYAGEQGTAGADAQMEDAEESAAGPEAMAAAEAAREAGIRARNQGRRNYGARSMEALVEDMIEQAYAGDGLEVCTDCYIWHLLPTLVYYMPSLMGTPHVSFQCLTQQSNDRSEQPTLCAHIFITVYG